jgi:hypothetical protein
MPTLEQKAAALARITNWTKEVLARQPFKDRGFSDPTIDVLVSNGIAAPEMLLFASETKLKRIPGLEAASLAEIRNYRGSCSDRKAETRQTRSKS